MDMKICKSTYKDIDAITIENECLKVQFTPQYGAKMVSMVHKKTSREILQQAENPSYKVLEYSGDFVNAECSGFDDMFPTIDRVIYPDYPWKWVEMPDHGEVCGLKWDCEVMEDSLYMAVNGVRFPYRLEKWICFSCGNTLNISYKATNLSTFDMDFLWTAHAMIDAGSGGEIILPYKDSHEARVVFTTDERLGAYGDTISWPVTVDREGKARAINSIKVTDDRIEALKYYFKGQLPEGWCEFRYKEDGTRLVLSFPKDMVPYFGILISEKHGLILEPCTGTMDRPDMAKLFRQNSILPAKGEYTWHLNMQVE